MPRTPACLPSRTSRPPNLSCRAAYELTLREHRVGGPESPISASARAAYAAYWRRTLVAALSSNDGPASAATLAERTGMRVRSRVRARARVCAFAYPRACGCGDEFHPSLSPTPTSYTSVTSPVPPASRSARGRGGHALRRLRRHGRRRRASRYRAAPTAAGGATDGRPVAPPLNVGAVLAPTAAAA